MSDEIPMKRRTGLFSSAAFAVLMVGSLGTSAPAVAVTCDSVTNPAGGASGASDGGNVNATACGSSATASSSQSTAIGGSAQATGFNSAAVGTQSTANGLNATAMGAFASSSSNGTAVGFRSAAVTSAVAIGVTSEALGASAVALGPSANANFANSTAIGGGATTTRANQQSFGTAANTYTMSGLTSAASLAAQTGPVSFVTTDAAGNLATSAFNPGSIAVLDSRVTTLENSVNSLNFNVRKAFEGAAVAIAMGGSALPDNKRFAISANWGNFSGENAFGGMAQMRISDNFVANAAIGAGFARGGIGGRVGGTFAW
jgi:trimeric autotransporter adhesin